MFDQLTLQILRYFKLIMIDQKEIVPEPSNTQKIYLTPKKRTKKDGRLSTQAFFYSQSSQKQCERFDLSQSKPHQNIKQFNKTIQVQSYNSKSNSINGIGANDKIQFTPSKNDSQLQVCQSDSNSEIYQNHYKFTKKQPNEFSYQEVIEKMLNQKHFQIQRPTIFKEKPFFLYSKLLTFSLNAKNSKMVVFDSERQTLKPIFICQYCKCQFKKAAALGGHISKCTGIKQRNYKHQKKKRKIGKRINIILTRQRQNELSESGQIVVVSCSQGEKKFDQAKKHQLKIAAQQSNDPKVYNLRQKGKKNYTEL